jgi:hypothetical protein
MNTNKKASPAPSEDVGALATEWAEKFKTGSLFEKIRIEAFKAGYTVASKQSDKEQGKKELKIVDMSFKEMIEGIYNVDFMTAEERLIIYTTGEIYAATKVRNAASQSSDEASSGVVTCVFCEEVCEAAPTKRGWASVKFGNGLHFDCARKVSQQGEEINKIESI